MDSLWHVECGLEATHYCGKHAKFYLHKMEQKQKSNWINRSEMKFRMNGLKFGVAFYRSSQSWFYFFSSRDRETERGPKFGARRNVVITSHNTGFPPKLNDKPAMPADQIKISLYHATIRQSPMSPKVELVSFPEFRGSPNDTSSERHEPDWIWIIADTSHYKTCPSSCL